MILLVRAFVWLRFKLVLGALRQGRSRGGLSAFAAWAQAGTSILLALVAVAMAGGLGWLAWLGAPALVGDDPALRGVALFTVRTALVVPLVGAALMPFVIAASGGGHARPRLLLLPISERLLHALEVVAAMLDPWIFLATPALVVLAVGLGRAEGLRAAALPLVGTALFVLVLAALSTLVSSLLQLILRDRRNAEGLTVVVMVVIVALSAIPAVLEGSRVSREARERQDEAAPTEEDPSAREALPLAELAETFPIALTVVPSEALSRVIAGASAGRAASAALGLAVLLFEALAVLALSTWAWSRLSTSAQTLSRRGGAGGRVRLVRLPLCSPGTSAVAVAFARGAVRTVQGKLAFLMPPVTVGLFGVVGIGLSRAPATVLAFSGVAFVLLALQAFLLNQLAVEGAGFARQLLAPLSSHQILRGKLIGGSLLAASYSLACLVVVAALRREGSPILWLAVWVGSLGAYVPLAAVGALTSVLLPKRVDLGKLGKQAQPHQLAAVIGVLATPLAVAPPALAAWMGSTLPGGAWTALGLEAVWLGLMALIAWPIERAAAGLLDSRAEKVLLEATRS